MRLQMLVKGVSSDDKSGDVLCCPMSDVSKLPQANNTAGFLLISLSILSGSEVMSEKY
jgi:hypothetical protein